MSFHDIRFPIDISLGAVGGPERRTEVVVLGSGREERNARWADSRRSYNAGYGVKSIDDLYAVVGFFEERRGRLHGFRWRDPTDWKSCPPSSTPSASDQTIGTGNGTALQFQLTKTYGSAFLPWARKVTKPVMGSVLVAVDGMPRSEGADFAVDFATGLLTFAPTSVPAPGAVVTAGFEFDVPVRFDNDRLEINLQGFRHGAIPSIPIVETLE
ncbi:MAG: TIGR02217 family protein [Hyphomicrobiaceae bacterium]